MPRTARLVVPGCPHHIVQRGNNRRQAERFGLAVQAYCLMTNHLHPIATPRAQDSLAKGVGRTNLYYTRYVNGLHGRSGHLWQDRFFSSALDEEWFWNALIYVERTAVRAKRVRKAWCCPWSSAAAHGGGRDRTGLPDLSAWGKLLARGLAGVAVAATGRGGRAARAFVELPKRPTRQRQFHPQAGAQARASSASPPRRLPAPACRCEHETGNRPNSFGTRITPRTACRCRW